MSASPDLTPVALDTIDWNAILQNPAGAPLLPVSTAREAAPVMERVASLVNARPAAAPALVEYFRRHPGRVRVLLIMMLAGVENNVSPEAVAALLDSESLEADVLPAMVQFSSMQALARRIDQATLHARGVATGDEAALIDLFYDQTLSGLPPGLPLLPPERTR